MRHKFTVRKVESATPAERPYELHDSEVKGLVLRVQPSGIKSFIVQFGRSKRVTLKPRYPALTLEAARTQARDILSQAQHGVPDAAKRSKKHLTFDDFLTERYGPWVLAERKAGKATLANLRAQFGDLFGKKPLTDITAWSLEKFKADRLRGDKEKGTRPAKPATVNRDLDRIRAALNKAVEWKLLAENPLMTVKRSKGGDSHRVRFLSDDEAKRLRAALHAREDERRRHRASGNAWARERGRPTRPEWTAEEFTDHLAPLVLVALNTGLRRGELLGLAWSAVSLDRAQLTVTAATAKAGKVRHIPLNAEALDALTRWHKQTGGEGLVFPGTDGAQMTHIKRSWAGLVAAADINDFRFHDLRHDFASRLVMARVDLYAVKELLGHSEFAMTQRYAHLAPDHLAAAVAALVPVKRSA
jgi:integrase